MTKEHSKEADSTDFLIYCRKALHDQFSYLRRNVLESNQMGFIYGPPGNGKSTTALAFALSDCVDEHWTVTWLHLSRYDFPNLMRIKKNTIETVNLIHDDDELTDWLDDVQGAHLLFVDGFVQNRDEKHTTFLHACTSWKTANKKERRLVVTSSMSFAPRVDYDFTAKFTMTNHCVFSWTFEEYSKAVAQDEFWEQVKPRVLDASTSSEDASLSSTREELLKPKYHFAGVSCRFMFGLPTHEVIQAILHSVRLPDNLEPYLLGTMGDRFDQAVNRLLGLDSDFRRFVVSEFASIQCASRLGYEMVLRYADICSRQNNPHLMGWIFEMFVFSCLLTSKTKSIEFLNVSKGVKEEWPKIDQLKVVDPLAVEFDINGVSEGIWYQPKKWNQGGYDAFFIDIPQKFVRFVQITNAVEHDLRLDYMAQVLNTIPKDYKIDQVEVVFIISKQKAELFEIGDVTGRLKDHGFGTPDEAKRNCKVLALDYGWTF